MKYVVQLDPNGYAVGYVPADESPLEPGVYLLPAGTIDAVIPEVPEGMLVRWDNGWLFEQIQTEEPPETADCGPDCLDCADCVEQNYAAARATEYPPMADYLDGIVKGDQAQIDKYIADCLAVKAKYPKPQ